MTGAAVATAAPSGPGHAPQAVRIVCGLEGLRQVAAEYAAKGTSVSLRERLEVLKLLVEAHEANEDIFPASYCTDLWEELAGAWREGKLSTLEATPAVAGGVGGPDQLDPRASRGHRSSRKGPHMQGVSGATHPPMVGEQAGSRKLLHRGLLAQPGFVVPCALKCWTVGMRSETTSALRMRELTSDAPAATGHSAAAKTSADMPGNRVA